MSEWQRRRRVERNQAQYAQMNDAGPVLQDEQLPLPQDVVATNTGVRLACTMAAMIGLFAIFLCWVEKESRVIRRFAVQSASLTATHAIMGAGVMLVCFVLGFVPYLGLLVTLIGWLVYIAALILLIVVRLKLMERAWRGLRFDLPAPMERLLRRFY